MKHRHSVTVTLFAAAAILCASTAHAGPEDDANYLSVLHSHGIGSVDGDASLISFGHGICSALGRGYTMAALEDVGDINERHGLSDADVKLIVKAAAATYCPEEIR